VAPPIVLVVVLVLVTQSSQIGTENCQQIADFSGGRLQVVGRNDAGRAAQRCIRNLKFSILTLHFSMPEP
jgi:hypothetical protein